MTKQRKLEGKISECNEVKGVCPESEPQPRESFTFWVRADPFSQGAGHAGSATDDERRMPPRGRRQHRVAQRHASNQASDEQGLLGKRAMQVPEYDHQCKKRCSDGRVASDGDRYTAMVSDEVG